MLSVHPMLRASVLLGALFILGTLGYAAIGGPTHSLLDAAYMTVITLTTVGYHEIIDLSGNPAGQVFTMVLLFVGVGSFLYFFSNLTAFMVEGTLDRIFWRRRMLRQTSRLSDHIILCGGGDTGEHVVQEFLHTRRPFVLIETKQERVDTLYAKFGEFLVIVGDATDDDVLLKAGLKNARGLLICTSSDKDNLVVTFSARNLNPHLRIVTRCMHTRDQGKLRLAGADAVVYPNRVGGLRMASEMVRPTAVSFLDTMLRDQHAGLRVEEIVVGTDSPLVDRTVGDLRRRGIEGLLVVALRSTDDGQWLYNPPDHVTLKANTAIVFMGTPDTLAQVEFANQ